MANSIIRNSFYNALKTTSTIVFPMILFPYVSRVLGPEYIGKINFTNAYVQFFNLIATLGITAYAVRECAKAKDDRILLSKIASEIFSINVVMMAISYALLVLSVGLLPDLRRYWELVLLSSLSIFFNVIGTDWINTAMEDFKYIAVRTFLCQGVSVLGVFMLVTEQSDYYWFVGITVVAVAMGNMLNWFYRKRFCDICFTVRCDIKRHITPIFFLFALLIAQYLMCNIDITMLGLMTTDVIVGYYSTAVKIKTITEMIISSIAFVLLPQLSYHFSCGNYESINKVLSTTLGYIVSMGLPCSVGLFVMAEDIMNIVGGEAFLPAANLLKMLSIAMFVNLLGGSFFGNLILLPSNKEKQFMVACLISAAINVGLNWMFIPTHGAMGAAFTTIVSVAVVLMICSYGLDSRIKLKFEKQDFIGSVIGVVGIVGIAYVVGRYQHDYIVRLIIVILLSSLYYGACLYYTKNTLLSVIMGKLGKGKS